MSIELSNGVILPDLPADVLAEHPNAIIFTNQNSMYMCGFTKKKYMYVPANLVQVISSGQISEPVIGVLGEVLLYTQSNDSWIYAQTFQNMSYTGPDNFLWSNHDIEIASSVDMSTGELVSSGEIYFPNSLADPIPEIMSVTGEWLVSMAGHTRRLSGTSDKFTPEQMDEFYGTLEIPEAGEVTLQEKSVEPSTEAQEVVADSGFDGLSKVSVGAVALREETVTPASADFVVTPGDGYIGLSTVTVKAAPTQGIIIVPSTEQQLIKPSGDIVGYSQIRVMPPSMEKLTVTPTTEEQVFTPTTGYVGFSTITVEAAEGGGGGVEYPNVMEVSF